LVSLPGQDPTVSQNFDWFVQRARNAGPGWHCMTNAEWAALALWCWKNGYMPTGNNNWGRDHAEKFQTGRRVDGNAPGDESGTGRTYTGSGPVAWNHDGSSSGIADLNGNIYEWAPGLRLMDGEIQVIPDNDAALNATDMSPGSSEWRAILVSDGSLVSPGTSGTLKYDAPGGTLELSDVITNMQGDPGDNSNGDSSSIALQSLTEGNGITAPDLAKALALFPVDSNLESDRLYVRNYGERLPRRGGHRSAVSHAGVFYLHLSTPRTYTNTYGGSRPAFVI
ncbi:MAG TPA: hypothetical protein VK062_05025, partial [Burkholderiaceae bacterium]|nr:hypothetical protein [Burkholderiaceae bacterium]